VTDDDVTGAGVGEGVGVGPGDAGDGDEGLLLQATANINAPEIMTRRNDNM
jgi:hypothetical protein